MESELNAALTSLASEQRTLEKLLLRNHNQHGKSRLFSYLKRLSKTLSVFLPTEALKSVIAQGEKALRLKVSSNEVSTSLVCLGEQKKVLLALIEAIESASRASSILKEQLRDRLFLPLFTLLFALASRVLSNLAALSRVFRQQHSLLLSKITNVAAIHTKYSLSITTAAHEVKLSDDQTRVLTSLAPERGEAARVEKKRKAKEAVAVDDELDE